MNNTNDNNIDWSNPPISDDIPIFESPKTKRIPLEKGAELMHYFNDSHPLVSFKIVFHKGTAQEEYPGISKVMFELLSSGTQSRSAFEFASELDYLGASINFNESKDYAVARLNTLTEVFESSFELFLESLLEPKFDEQEVEKAIRKLISAKQQEESDSSYLSSTAMMTAQFREHPYGSPEYGYADEIDNINRKSIKNNWESYVNESKISIVATGAISESDAIRYSQQIVDKMCSNVTEKDIEEIPKREQNRLVLVDYDSDNQSLIRVGKPTINILDENYAALSLLNVIYGGYFMSRLNNLIREQKGLSYGVHSSLSSAKCTGLLGVGTSVKAANTQEVVNDIIEEMSLLSNEMLEEEELKRAKNYFLGSFLRSAESYKQISKMLVTMTLNGLPDNYYDDFYSKIRRIRSDDLFSAQIDLLKPEGLVIAIAGKVDNIAPQFDQFIDKYDLLDAEGKILNRTENNS